MENLQLLELMNETLATAIVVVAASMLLYNLTRNLNNRVARTSGGLLGCVTLVYIGDVLISLDPGPGTIEALLRFQWIGLAFIPATMFHLSDALLATTGLPSRGRRRRASRFQYAVATVFLILAAFTDLLVMPVLFDGRVGLRAGVLFPVYLAFFVLANVIAFINVERARRRCLTRSTKRRMTYLEVAMITPIMGVFPYSVLLNPGDEFSTLAVVVVNLANFFIACMLVFLAYPLSFFGSEIPDRVVKAELLRFMLLGPATGLLALVTLVYTNAATELLSVPGTTFMPFAVVAVILMWQWLVDLTLPWLERRLVYWRDEDADQLAELQNLSERLLTRADLLQLVEATLEATCDYLRVNKAFVLYINAQTHSFELIRQIGGVEVDTESQQVSELLSNLDKANKHEVIRVWNGYWIIPLYSGRNNDDEGQPELIGIMGIEARSEVVDLTEDDEDMLTTFTTRASRTLDDLLLQSEIYAALEGLLPQIAVTRRRASELEYRPGRKSIPAQPESKLNREEVIEQVQAALRHYSGGPGMSSSRLLELEMVRDALPEHENNPTRALRSVLQEAIENQRPVGEPDLKSPEWMVYNILTLRFIEGRKVRDVSRRLYMGEATFYRKQNVAIETVADTIIQMEESHLQREQNGGATQQVLSDRSL